MKTFKSFFLQLFTNKLEYAVHQGDKQTIVGLIYLIVFSTSIMGGFVMYFYDMNSSLSLLLLGAVSLLGWMVNRAGHTRSSAVILIAALLATIQYNIFAGFGIHDVAIIAWPAFIFFFGMLFGWKIIPYITALIMLLAGVANMVPNAQFISNYSDTGDLIVMLLILVAFSLIAISLLRGNEHLIQRSQRSEERSQAIFNSINDAILLCDSQTGVILNFNQKTSEMFGNICQEAASLDTAPISSDNLSFTQAAALEMIKKAATQGAQHFEWQIRDKSERSFWVDVNLKLAPIAGQALVMVSVQDITGRKTSEQQREVLYQVHSAVSSHLDVELVVRSAVETIVRLTGYLHVCIALPHKDGAHWVVRGAAGSLAAETGATYPLYQGVIGRAFKTGQLQWVRDILDDPDYVRDVSTPNAPALRSELVVPLCSGDRLHGALNVESDRVDEFSEADVRMLQSVADMIALALENARLYGEAQQEISERKQAEKALSESEERLKEAQRIALIGNWELNLRNKHVMWSDEVYRIFEIDPVGIEASNAAFLNAVHPEDRAMIERAYKASLENKSLYDIEYRLLMLDGRVKYVHEHCETFYDTEGHALRSVGTLQDITDRKRAEAAQR